MTLSHGFNVHGSLYIGRVSYTGGGSDWSVTRGSGRGEDTGGEGSAPGEQESYGAVLRTRAEPCRTYSLDVQPCAEYCDSSSRRRSGSSQRNSCTTCRSKCSSGGGAWEGTTQRVQGGDYAARGGVCKVTMQLRTLSWVVPEDAPVQAPGPWTAAHGVRGFTLSPASGDTHDDIAGYAAAPCVPGGQAPVTVTVSLRSAADPYVVAAALTGWSFDFGNTQARPARRAGCWPRPRSLPHVSA